MDRKSLLLRAEWLAALALSFVALVLHVRLLLHGGPLWRDEISSLNLAMAPSFGQFWRVLLPDTFPALFFLLLRAWGAVGLAGNDLELRALGCFLGLGTIAMTWLVCWRLNRTPPLWPLALMAVAALTFQCHDQLRPYGLSVLLVTASYGIFWDLAFARAQNWRSLILGAVVATLAVQTGYTNAVFIFALGLAGAAIALSRGAGREALNILAVGAVAALSLVPYLVSFSANHRWLVLLPGAQSFAAVFSVLDEALTVNHWSMPWIWAGLILMALLSLGFTFRSGAERGEKEKLSFAAIALFLATALMLLFFRVLHWQMHPRYFFALLCFAALSLHILLHPIARGVARERVVIIAVVVAALQLPWAYHDSGVRLTNFDVAANTLTQNATADDFILLSGFWLGLSFDRYYHGPTKWKSIPEINDFSSYRWDLAMQAMSNPDPLAGLFQDIQKTLQNGHKVFLVGNIVVQLPPTVPEPLPPAPQTSYGWNLRRYMANWHTQIAYYLEHHSEHKDSIPVKVDQPVYDLEDAGIVAISGYRAGTR